MNKNKFSAESRFKVAALILSALLLLAAVGAGIYILTQGEITLHPAEPFVITLPEAETALPERMGADTGAAGEYFPAHGRFFEPDAALLSTEAEAILSGGETREGGEALTEKSFAELLTQFLPEAEVRAALDCIRGLGDETVTRAEGAVCFNRLFGVRPAAEEQSYYPDVAPDYWAWGDITAAAVPGLERLSEGFFLDNGWLYRADENGYVLKNGYCGSLYFDYAGRYTSGSAELDGYVAAAIAKTTNSSMKREEMLRAMYDYVRDSFEYRIRNYYEVGDLGWQIQEALTMYSTGKGNCYCYAAAFWAAARALGYDAKIVSGTYGKELSPHGWVEIAQDGQRRFYDVEIEMSSRRDGKASDMYGLTEEARMIHGYREVAMLDEAVSRRHSNGIAPK